MEHIWLHKTLKRKLLLFFCGWGNDNNPFAELTSTDFDVLFLYDYKTLKLPFSLEDTIARYEETVVVAWSLGVTIANNMIDAKSVKAAYAVNGTVPAIHVNFGIPPEIYNGTLDNLDEKNRDKFFKRMCLTKEALSYFNRNLPQRSVDEQKQELIMLKTLILESDTQNKIFTHAIIGMNDAIFPPENMISYWEMQLPKDQLKIFDQTPHFPFFMYNDFKDIIS